MMNHLHIKSSRKWLITQQQAVVADALYPSPPAAAVFSHLPPVGDEVDDAPIGGRNHADFEFTPLQPLMQQPFGSAATRQNGLAEKEP